MKVIASILILIFFTNCNSPESRNSLENLSNFNRELGVSHSQVLNKLVDSQNDFLEINYPEIQSQKARAIQFLKDNKSPGAPTRWKHDEESLVSLRNAIEVSGFRKEAYIYDFEDTLELEEFIEIPIRQRDTTDFKKTTESILRFNRNGNYFKALQTAKQDSLVQNYTDALDAAADINPSLVANGLLVEGFDYDYPVHQRILAVAFYLKLILWKDTLK